MRSVSSDAASLTVTATLAVAGRRTRQLGRKVIAPRRTWSPPARAAISGGLLIAALLSVCARVSAHDVQSEFVVEMFAKIDPAALHIVMRVPMPLLADAGLPRVDGVFLDLAGVEKPLELVGRRLPRVLEVWQGSSPLHEPARTWMVSAPGDASFTAFDSAAAHLRSGRLPTTARLLAGDCFADFALDYPIESAGGLSVRLNGLRLPNQQVRTILRIVETGGVVRTMAVSGDPERVFFDPSWIQAVQRAATAAVQRLWNGGDVWWFLLCLVIPLYPVRTAAAGFIGLGAGQTTALIASAWGLPPSSSRVVLLAQLVAALALVVAGTRNIASQRSRGSWLPGLALGLGSGFQFGAVFDEVLPFAGEHVAVSLVAFALVVLSAQLWFVLVTKPAVEWIYRSGWATTGRSTLLVLSALVIHAGLHRLIERGQLVADAGWPAADRASILAIAIWTPALIAMGYLLAQLTARLDPPEAASAGSGAVGTR